MYFILLEDDTLIQENKDLSSPSSVAVNECHKNDPSDRLPSLRGQGSRVSSDETPLSTSGTATCQNRKTDDNMLSDLDKEKTENARYMYKEKRFN